MSHNKIVSFPVAIIKQKGCSQQEIADYLGVTREAYSHYERNTREPNLEIIIKLIKFYQIEVSKLINETTIPITSNISPLYQEQYQQIVF